MKMNSIPKLKIIPLATVIALGLALSPSVTMAGDKQYDSNHKGQKSQYSHDAGKTRIKQPRIEKHVTRGDDRRGHGPVIKNHHIKPYIVHSKKVYYRDRPYGHEHYGHGRTEYIIVDHDHHAHYVDYEYVDFDDVRLQIGVHTGNFDIVFRD
jgi:hypothetical protein